MVFLHVAPSNTVTKQHGEAVDDWIYPEFEQNWKLFAPNPLAAEHRGPGPRPRSAPPTAARVTTGWYDLSAQDGRAIDGNLLPSHTQQNELRRAWDFFVATHDSDNRPVGLRGSLSETYLRRIVVLRLDREDAAGKGDALERVQVRSRTTNVPPAGVEQREGVGPAGLPGAALVAVPADSTRRTVRQRTPQRRAAPRRTCGEPFRRSAVSRRHRPRHRVRPRPVPDRRDPHRLQRDLAAVPAARVPAPPGAVRPRRPLELGPRPAADRRPTAPSRH